MKILKNLFAFILTLLVSFSVFANEDLISRYEQKNQPMPSSGDYAGETIESSSKRTIIILSKTEKEIFGIDTEDLAFANFKHNNTFYIASIPAIKLKNQLDLKRATNVVESVSFMKEHWAGQSRPETKNVEVHSELIFTFQQSSGIELHFNQDERKEVQGAARIYKAVLSIEAIRSEQNIDAGFLPGGLGYNFAVGYRFYSAAQRDIKNETEVAATYTEHDLDFSDTVSYSGVANAMDYLLYQSLKTSHQMGRNQTYNFVQNNCTNRLFDLLDISMGYNQSNGGAVRFDQVGESYIDFVNNDLEGLISLLSQMAADKHIVIPKDVQALLNQAAKGLALKQLQDMQKTYGSQDNVKNLLYALPPFIDGHLKARGLIK